MTESEFIIWAEKFSSMTETGQAALLAKVYSVACQQILWVSFLAILIGVCVALVIKGISKWGESDEWEFTAVVAGTIGSVLVLVLVGVAAGAIGRLNSPTTYAMLFLKNGGW